MRWCYFFALFLAFDCLCVTAKPPSTNETSSKMDTLPGTKSSVTMETSSVKQPEGKEPPPIEPFLVPRSLSCARNQYWDGSRCRKLPVAPPSTTESSSEMDTGAESSVTTETSSVKQPEDKIFPSPPRGPLPPPLPCGRNRDWDGSRCRKIPVAAQIRNRQSPTRSKRARALEQCERKAACYAPAVRSAPCPTCTCYDTCAQKCVRKPGCRRG